MFPGEVHNSRSLIQNMFVRLTPASPSFFIFTVFVVVGCISIFGTTMLWAGRGWMLSVAARQKAWRTGAHEEIHAPFNHHAWAW